MIDEKLAREAKRAYSLFEYKEGSATKEYEQMVSSFNELAEEQKKKVDIMYHEKIDNLCEKYAKRLADNINERNRITASCPSIMIAGRANFDVKRKEKQNEQLSNKLKEFERIEELRHKVKSIGTAGISSDNKNVIQLLEEKILRLEGKQNEMKEANKLCKKLGKPKAHESYELSNNSAVIRNTKKRLENEKLKASTVYEDYEFLGGRVVHDKEDNRLKLFFDEVPEVDVRQELKRSGFKWSRKNEAWQRMLNNNSIYVTRLLLKELDLIIENED